MGVFAGLIRVWLGVPDGYCSLRRNKPKILSSSVYLGIPENLKPKTCLWEPIQPSDPERLKPSTLCKTSK